MFKRLTIAALACIGAISHSSSMAAAQDNPSAGMLQKEDYIGKHLLIGVTFLDSRSNVIEQFQTHGTIKIVEDTQSIVIEKADGTGRYAIPPDLSQLHAATPGEYKLQTSGEIVRNPDFVSTWSIMISPEDDREEQLRTIETYKLTGFAPD